MRADTVRPTVVGPDKPARPTKADGFKQALARSMEGAGPSAPESALRPRPAAIAARPIASVVLPEPAFRQRIAALESGGSGGHLARNASSGALGRYQMLGVALRDIGWQDAGGGWTATAAQHGVRSEADFLANAGAQEAAMGAYLQRTEAQLNRNGALAQAGRAVAGLDGGALVVTESGLMAAAHRRGAHSVARYLAHRTETPDAPLSRGDAQAFAAVERRLRDFAELPYAVASRRLPRAA